MSNFNLVIYFILTCITFLLSIPILVVTAQLFISMVANRKQVKWADDIELPKFAILMPAHNEELIIADTLAKLMNQSIAPSDVYLVADNCDDNTSTIAKTYGVNVIERVDNTLRGKGYALTHGLKVLKQSEKHYACVIILDADCEIDKESLGKLAKYSVKNHVAVQALYLMRVVNQSSIKQRIAGFAWLVKNKLRPLAMRTLGMPITLTGTGMAFPLDILRNVNFNNGNIVEDMQLGIDLTSQGHAPHLLPDAIVYSDFPQEQNVEISQRTRWEHGHIRTILNVLPLMIKTAIKKRNFKLFALSLDIAVPPLALLVMLCLCYFLFLVLCQLYLQIDGLLTYFVSLLSLFFMAVFIAWWTSGREYLSLKDFLSIPYYVLGKITIYINYIFKQQVKWNKTKRDE
ncbi:hypothetical protein LCGC14_1611120 [marine sediment metagenome]|uniref:Glycosyltransferase 2-like domain-containing protein n=1 Tax=marine sediment metagenome TaxID=412755 RepID=A0A0F9I8I8_9ZZZZ